MKAYRLGSLLWSVGLIVIGLLLLSFNLGFLIAYRPLVELLLAGGFVLAGLLAFIAYVRTPANWWWLILAWTLLALAVTIFLSYFGNVDRPFLAAALLAGITLAFLHVYGIDRRMNWWSVIPAGFLLVVGVVSTLNHWTDNTSLLGAVLLAGFGLVFVILYLLEDKNRFWWALIPGGALLTVALVTLTADLAPTNLLLRSWPLLLILTGLYVGLRPPKAETVAKLEVNQAPKMRKVKNPAKSEAMQSALGEYSQAAPGTTIDILADPD